MTELSTELAFFFPMEQHFYSKAQPRNLVFGRHFLKVNQMNLSLQ